MAKTKNMLGSWAFLIGVLLAVIVGIFNGLEIYSLNTTLVVAVLMVIGIIIGLFNITSVESMPFLFSGLALIIAGVFGAGVLQSVPVASSTLVAMLEIFIPATIVVAIRNVFSMAKN
ncbi:MAG: hypothetical protein AABX17_02950 [Nanoarchaeota archaeon]